MIDTKFYQDLGPLSLVNLLDGLRVEIPEGQFCDEIISGAAPFNEARTGDIAYIEGRRKNVEASGATAVFVTKDNAQAVTACGSIALITPTPRADFAQVLPRLFRPQPFKPLDGRHGDAGISARAHIDETAQIGKGTQIGPGAYIGPGVEIGENCSISPNAVVEFTRMGDNCVIHNGAAIGTSGFGVAATKDENIDIPHLGSVLIGDNVSVGANSCIDRAMFGQTRIGNGCKFDNLVQIAHNCVIGARSMFASHTGISGSCTIGERVIMGGNVGIADHVQIADDVVLAARSGVMKDLLDAGYYGGAPAVPIREFLRQVACIQRLAKPKKTKT